MKIYDLIQPDPSFQGSRPPQTSMLSFFYLPSMFSDTRCILWGRIANKSTTEAALQGGGGGAIRDRCKAQSKWFNKSAFKTLLRHPVDCLISIGVATFKIKCSEL